MNKSVLFFLSIFSWLLPQAQSSLSAATKPTPTAGAATDSAVNMLQVLFATNEDGDLYINNNHKGTVSKAAYKYIPMTPGRYTYRLKSKATGDEYKGSFVVAAGGLNEVFADLLFAVDEAKHLRDSILANAAKEPPPVVRNTTTADTANRRTLELPPAEEVMTMPAGKEVEKWKYLQIASINAMEAAMTSLPGGPFVMGNNRAPSTDEAEHAVFLSPFLFSKYEVTQRQWELIMGYNPSVHKGCPTCPVENVSWEEAVKFIQKINSLTNKRFRLPTEAEWEYVARFGGRLEIEKAGSEEQFIKNVAWYYGNADKQTHPIANKAPTAAGVYDLFGNVAEWCADWYDASYLKEEGLQNDPQGPPLGKDKVVRGGSFADYTGDRFRPSLRTKLKPTHKDGNLGFRLVMDKRS